MNKKILPVGTEVLVFKYIREHGPSNDKINYIKGVVMSRKDSNDLSQHGSPWYEQVYTVLGEDGKEYYGTYGNGLLGNAFFRTIDDHIDCLESRMSLNNEKIENLRNDNNYSLKTIHNLKMTQLESIINKNKEKLENIIKHYSKIGSLDLAVVYPKDGKHISLLLSYSNWNCEIQMLSHGLYFQNFDRKDNIDLELCAGKTEDVVGQLDDVNMKVLYPEKQIKQYKKI